MTILYTSASGRQVTHSSSSSLDTFRLCRRKFKLSKKDGWRPKARKASTEIGKCLESALQFYYDNGQKPGDFVDEWKRLWLKFKDIEMVYTDQEGGWSDVYKIGTEWGQLGEVKLKTLPIRNPKWQLQFLKKLWPGDPTFGDLEFMAYIDILSTLEDGTRIITDVKTAKSDLPVTPGMMSLDGQLRKYAWVTGVREISFLNFVKCRPDDFKKGTHITLLEDISSDLKAGQPLVVAKFQAPKPAVEAAEGIKASVEVPWGLWAGTEESVQLMDEELDKISGKGSKENSALLFARLVMNGTIIKLDRHQLTKTRLQFVRGSIPEEDLAGIGDAIGTDMLAIYQAEQKGCFPLDGGVRFPNAICGWCEFNPSALKTTLYEMKLWFRLKRPEPERDWLDELVED